MPLNISKGNMYDFVTHTWNTVKGQCYHDCSYCYMKRFGNLKPVRFDNKELKTDLGSGNFIFVGSSCDVFAQNISDDIINKTIQHVLKYPDNGYLFQTKNPKRFSDFMMPIRSILGTTIETNRIYPQMGNAPIPEMRSSSMNRLKDYIRFVTVEPIMDFDLDKMIDIIRFSGASQVNIGADSGNNNLPEPSRDKVLELMRRLERFIHVNVVMKKNLSRIIDKK